MFNDLRIDISLSHKGHDFKAYTMIPESKLTASFVDDIMTEIGCSVRRACINNHIVPDPLADLNLEHDEQNTLSISSDLEKSKVTGVLP